MGIWFVRHGNRLDFVQPDWFDVAPRRYDPPLCPDGHLQARELGDRLRCESIQHIFVSPFLRGLQTANYCAIALDLPLKVEAGLGEWHNPDWMTATPETQPRELCMQDFPLIDWSYVGQVVPRYPESSAQMMARSAATLRRLMAQFEGNLLIVSHKMPILACLSVLLERQVSAEVDVCALSFLARDGDRWEWHLQNDSSFLSNPGIKIAHNH